MQVRGEGCGMKLTPKYPNCATEVGHGRVLHRIRTQSKCLGTQPALRFTLNSAEDSFTQLESCQFE